MIIFFELQIDTDFIVRVDCEVIEFEVIFSNWPCGRNLEFFWFALDGIHIGWRKWGTTEWPGARFFPLGIAILAMFTFTLDISLSATFLEPVFFNSEFVWWIATEKLGDWKIFSEDGLRWGISLSNVSKLVRHIWASDTWREFWMSPSVVFLAFDFPSTLWSPSNGAYSSTVCTRACYIPSTCWKRWFIATIMPLFIWSLQVYNFPCTSGTVPLR